MRNDSLAVSYALLCILAWSFIPVVAKLGQTDLDNYQFLFWSNLLSGGTIFLWQILAGKTKEFKTYGRRDLGLAFFLGFLGCCFYYVCLYLGYARGKGLEILVLQYTWPIFIVIFSFFLLKEKLGVRRILALILGFSGIFLVLSKGEFQDLRFSSWSTSGIVLLGSAAFALFSVLSKKAHFEELSSVTLYFLSGTFFSAGAMMAFSRFALPSFQSLAPVLVNGTLINGLSYVLWIKALQRGEASSLATLVFLTPVLAAIFLILFFKEAFQPIYGGGLVLVILSGILGQGRPVEKKDTVIDP